MYRSLVLIAAALLSHQAMATTINWTDWQSVSVWDGMSQSIYGELNVNGDIVDITVTSSSAFHNYQLGSGTNYWREDSPAPYTGGSISNAPTPAEQVMLGTGGTITVTFSQAILNPFMAINSWNNNLVTFSEAVSFDSYGDGYWGTAGTPTTGPSCTGSSIATGTSVTSFYGCGELHGVIALSGNTSGFAFTHTSETWHGLTIGVEGLASPVPAPSALLLFGLGLLGMGTLRKTVA